MNQTTRTDNNVVEIDLLEVLEVILNRIWLVILIGIIGAGLGFGYSKFFITPQYRSTTSVYILNRQNEETVTYSDTQLATQLTKDYEKLVTSRYVLEAVIEELTLDCNYSALASKVSVNNTSNTRIIEITVKDPDPQAAQRIANSIRDNAAAHIQEVMKIEAVNVVDEANLPVAPFEPSIKRYTAIGGMLGILLVVAILVLQYILDDSIKSEEDVERYLGLSTLALIPYDQSSEKEGGKGRKSRSSRSSDRKNMREAERSLQRMEETGKLPSAAEIRAARQANAAQETGRRPAQPRQGQAGYDERAMQVRRRREEQQRAGQQPGAERAERPADRSGERRQRPGRPQGQAPRKAADRPDDAGESLRSRRERSYESGSERTEKPAGRRPSETPEPAVTEEAMAPAAEPEMIIQPAPEPVVEENPAQEPAPEKQPEENAAAEAVTEAAEEPAPEAEPEAPAEEESTAGEAPGEKLAEDLSQNITQAADEAIIAAEESFSSSVAAIMEEEAPAPSSARRRRRQRVPEGTEAPVEAAPAPEMETAPAREPEQAAEMEPEAEENDRKPMRGLFGRKKVSQETRGFSAILNSDEDGTDLSLLSLDDTSDI